MLSCTELRDVTICPPYVPGGRNRQFWQAIAALGRLHGSRLQLQVLKPGAFRMLAAEPLLAAHVSQADLRCHPAMPWSAADVVSSLSSLTKLTLRDQDSVLGHAGMLDAPAAAVRAAVSALPGRRHADAAGQIRPLQLVSADKAAARNHP